MPVFAYSRRLYTGLIYDVSRDTPQRGAVDSAKICNDNHSCLKKHQC